MRGHYSTHYNIFFYNIRGETARILYMDDVKLKIMSKPLRWMILQALLTENLMLTYSPGNHDSYQVFSFFFYSDMKKVGVTVVGPQKKIISSIKALETQSKNGPVPV